MKHARTKTAYLKSMQVYKRSGKDWLAIVDSNIREALTKPKAKLSKEIAAQMLYKESMRNGWKSFIKYTG